MDYKAEQELEIESLQAIVADQLSGKAAGHICTLWDWSLSHGTDEIGRYRRI